MTCDYLQFSNLFAEVSIIAANLRTPCGTQFVPFDRHAVRSGLMVSLVAGADIDILISLNSANQLQAPNPHSDKVSVSDHGM